MVRASPSASVSCREIREGRSLITEKDCGAIKGTVLYTSRITVAGCEVEAPSFTEKVKLSIPR